MIAVDTNVLVLAARGSDEAARLVRARLSDTGPDLVIPVFCIGEFWRVVTHPRALSQLSAVEAATFLSELTRDGEALLMPGDRYWALLREMALTEPAAGSRIFDYQIAAVCAEHSVAEILTFDLDFPSLGRFNVTDPLQ